MNQDLKDYCRRTAGANIGMLIPQIILLIIGQTSFVAALFTIVIIESMIFAIYLLIFGVKRKDGTIKRFRKISIIMDALAEMRRND